MDSDAATEVLELAEELADMTDDAWLIFTHKDKKGLIISGLAIVSGVALAAGTAGYFLAKKRVTAKYEQIIKEEISDAREFYARLNKKEEFATPGQAAEALGADHLVEDAVEAMEQYQGDLKIEREETVIETSPIVPTARNIFRDNVPEDDVWDLAKEISNRTEEEPYIISHDEYEEGEREYEQSTLTYYTEDDVLIDEYDKPIPDVDAVAGEGNLVQFGHGSNDNRLVYIRNDRLALDFVVAKVESSYAKDVLGFQHSDDSPKQRKFRVRDE